MGLIFQISASGGSQIPSKPQFRDANQRFWHRKGLISGVSRVNGTHISDFSIRRVSNPFKASISRRKSVILTSKRSHIGRKRLKLSGKS